MDPRVQLLGSHYKGESLIPIKPVCCLPATGASPLDHEINVLGESAPAITLDLYIKMKLLHKKTCNTI